MFVRRLDKMYYAGLIDIPFTYITSTNRTVANSEQGLLNNNFI